MVSVNCGPNSAVSLPYCFAYLKGALSEKLLRTVVPSFDFYYKRRAKDNLRWMRWIQGCLVQS
jgi:hypothetical protein